jgi:D-alanyl-D-alanine carboxypeptidase
MRIRGAEAPRGLRWVVLSFITAFMALSLTIKSADARYSPPYADIVVDANSGKILHASHADSLRHPASLTKVMTLYLLFERLEAGTMTLNTELPVSAHAAAQAPSKLGVKPGDAIKVEDAIKSIVTRSANDVAVVIAEALAGDEANCAKLMTIKARELGMTHTVYLNASGLPDDRQVTTARDQALLGRAIQERFPQYFKYFSITRFVYDGHTVKGHNHLLGKVAGVDGIKTGYTEDSGFNLLTSVHRGNRYLVAVVMGGHSAGSRDERMRELIGDYIHVASTRHTAAPVVAADAITASTGTIPLPRPAPAKTAAASQPGPIAIAGSDAPLHPVAVKTVAVKPGAQAKVGPALSYAEVTPVPAPRPDILSVLKVKVASTSPAAIPAGPAAAKAHHEGWVIQIGAFDQEIEAKEHLYSAQNRAKSLLANADPFTEVVTKGKKTLYRARFAGLDKDRAEAACKYLKKKEISCMALKN